MTFNRRSLAASLSWLYARIMNLCTTYNVVLLSLLISGCGYTQLRQTNVDTSAAQFADSATIDAEKDRSSQDEKLLLSPLLRKIMNLSEEAETSVKASDELERILRNECDANGRIGVTISLRGNYHLENVLNRIRSLDVEIESVSPQSPIIVECAINPRSIRKLISIEFVGWVREYRPAQSRSDNDTK